MRGRGEHHRGRALRYEEHRLDLPIVSPWRRKFDNATA
ncbi:hypothetical protein N185_09665 [Sinorhizobium sp. GW3]|nr:hypothetical protein N185_09665 [Sinorhizobium sp. GW3]